jgi:hydroxyacylglutathione hydrolase
VFFRQYYLSCLSHASYLIGDTTTGKAVVVDPQRDVDEYLADAEANGLSIVKVIETHFHADFLSGHLELAERTGAAIVYGKAPRAAPSSPSRPTPTAVSSSSAPSPSRSVRRRATRRSRSAW